MHHQQRLNDEIESVKATILGLLSQSTHPTHQNLLCILTRTSNEEWLDIAAQQLGTEYNPLIERMNKLEAGQYGYCCDCEEKISAQRLEQDPAAQRCDQCAS